jgi:hypothetical protein
MEAQTPDSTALGGVRTRLANETNERGKNLESARDKRKNENNRPTEANAASCYNKLTARQGRSSVVEQRPFKPKVVGSIPTAPTNQFVFQAVAEALSNKTPISINCLSSLVLLSDFEPRWAAHLKGLVRRARAMPRSRCSITAPSALRCA